MCDFSSLITCNKKAFTWQASQEETAWGVVLPPGLGAYRPPDFPCSWHICIPSPGAIIPKSPPEALGRGPVHHLIKALLWHEGGHLEPETRFVSPLWLSSKYFSTSRLPSSPLYPRDHQTSKAFCSSSLKMSWPHVCAHLLDHTTGGNGTGRVSVFSGSNLLLIPLQYLIFFALWL